MSSPDDYGAETPETFFATCGQFKLGGLVTESINPITTGLAEDCQSKLATGLQKLQLADTHCLATLGMKKDSLLKIKQLSKEIHEVLEAGYCVFFEGCGATGRLSLTIEVLVREGLIEDKYRNQVKAFMAGGDAALIRSIEQFEDRRDFGARQLADLGFVDGDLCVAITEGGETTFVIAAVEEAVNLGPSRKHWFLYCNPDEILCPAAERSANVIANDKINKINLTCGAMAVTGSTRMQATTVQLLAAGLAVQHHNNPDIIEQEIIHFTQVANSLDYACFADCTVAEAELYKAKIPFCYQCEYFTCTVLTDTTERSPTFSLPAFESFSPPVTNPEKKDAPTPVYMHLPGTKTAHDAWQRLLRREPRGLQWDAVFNKTGNRAIMGYDFSDQVVEKRRYLLSEEVLKNTNNGKDLFVTFELELKNVNNNNNNNNNKSSNEKEEEENDDDSSSACFYFAVPKLSSFYSSSSSSSSASSEKKKGVEYISTTIDVPVSWVKSSPFQSRYQDPKSHYAQPLLLNVLAKMILNAHSTALMARNGRLRSNVMTYVRPSNKKLIDRAARYVMQLFDETTQANLPPNKRTKLNYEEVVNEIFVQRKTLGSSEPIVVKVLDVFIERYPVVATTASAAAASS